MSIQYHDWPIKGRDPTPAELQSIYESGFPGAPFDQAADDELFGDGLLETFSSCCGHLRDLHRNETRRVVPLFLSLFEAEKRQGLQILFVDEKQPYVNCVSRGSQHARAVTNAVEIMVGGEPETYVRPAWESTYRGRGHAGHGMNPATAARIDVESGFLWRRKYDFADLSSQNAAWGRGTGYPAAVSNEMENHAVGKWIRPESVDESLDLLAAGYACHSGQNVGFASRPNSKGYHPVSGRWNHDMATVGYDRSKEVWTVEVVFVPNSWGDFNSQPEDKFRERGWPRVPGMIVVEMDDWARLFVGARSMFFYVDVRGVPAKSLPDWGSRSYL